MVLNTLDNFNYDVEKGATVFGVLDSLMGAAARPVGLIIDYTQELDGLPWLLDSIRAKRPSAKVMIITKKGDRLPSDIASKVDQVLPAPFSEGQLIEAVEKMV